MRSRKTLYLLIPVGVGLAVIGMLIRFHMAPPVPSMSTRSLGAEIHSMHPMLGSAGRVAEAGGDEGVELRECVDATVKANLEFPSRVVFGRSFLVRLKSLHITSVRVSVQKSNCMNDRGEIVGSRREIDGSLDSKADRVLWLFDDGDIGFSMSLAGAEVRPEGLNRVSDGVAQWSVSPKSTGLLEGYVSPAKNTDRFRSGSNLPSIVLHSNDMPITIDVAYNPFTTERIFSWSAIFGGTVLTVPGIIAFVEEWLRKRREKAGRFKAESKITLQ